MARKTIWILVGVLAVALAAMLLTGQGTTPAAPVASTPAAQSRPAVTRPDQTAPLQSEATEPTIPATAGPTAPAETVPDVSEPEQTDPPVTEPEPTEQDRTEPPAQSREIFPVELENGMLTVESLFQFTGMNPDADNQFGEDIAGIELTNTSGSYLTEAEVTVILADGTVLTFLAEDVPAGRTVMVFSLEHAPVKDIRSCEEVYGYAEFDDSDPMQTGLVECTVDGIAITVRNISGTELNDLKVSCHELLDSSYFGGATYHYNVSTLPAGASTVIYAEECFLGMVEVVRVSLGG